MDSEEVIIPDAEVDDVMTLKPLKPRETPQLTTIRETLLNMISAEDAEEFFDWTEEHTWVNLYSRDKPEVCKKFASELKEKWLAWVAAWAPWKAKALVPFPEPLDQNSVTIGDLHKYLTELLAVHPDVAAIPVKHEECHSTVFTTDVVFDPEKSALIFS